MDRKILQIFLSQFFFTSSILDKASCLMWIINYDISFVKTEYSCWVTCLNVFCDKGYLEWCYLWRCCSCGFQQHMLFLSESLHWLKASCMHWQGTISFFSNCLPSIDIWGFTFASGFSSLPGGVTSHFHPIKVHESESESGKELLL